MTLAEIKTLRQISTEYGISPDTLKTRLKLKSYNLIENVDYKKLGERQPVLFSPTGVQKIIVSHDLIL